MITKITREEFIDARAGRRPFMDLPWVAVDSADEIGIFLSGGFGQIPRHIFSSYENYAASLSVVDLAVKKGWHYVFAYPSLGMLDRTTPYRRVSVPSSCRSGSLSLLVCPHVVCEGLLFEHVDSLLIDAHLEGTNA